MFAATNFHSQAVATFLLNFVVAVSAKAAVPLPAEFESHLLRECCEALHRLLSAERESVDVVFRSTVAVGTLLSPPLSDNCHLKALIRAQLECFRDVLVSVENSWKDKLGEKSLSLQEALSLF